MVNIKLTCSKERVSRSTRLEDTPTFLDLERNVSTKKLNLRLRSLRTPRRIDRRRLVGIFGMERHAEKTSWKKSVDLEENVKNLEGDVSNV